MAARKKVTKNGRDIDDMSLGEQIIAGLEDAVAYKNGDKTRGRVRKPRPGSRPIDVQAIRKKLGYSQEKFAAAFGVSVWTLRNWEQGKRQPEGPARVLLKVIEQEPEAVLRVVGGEAA